MDDAEFRKGIKRSTSCREEQSSGQDVECEEPANKFEQQLEAKRWRAYSDFYNSDTGATSSRYFRFRFFIRLSLESENTFGKTLGNCAE